MLIPYYLGSKTYTPLMLNESIPFYTVDETFAYAPKVQVALKDNLLIRDPQLIEHISSPNLYITESFPAKIMALLTLLTNSISKAFVLADAIFPAINFLLVYVLLFTFTKHSLISSVGSFCLIVDSYLLKVAHFPFSLLLRIQSDITSGTLLPFSRSFHPQVTFSVLVLSCLILYHVLSTRKKVFAVVFGILLGVLGYSYIYYSIFSITTYILVLFYFIVSKDRQIVYLLLLAGFVAFFCSFPVFIEFYKVINNKDAFNNFQLNFQNPQDDNFWLNIKIVITVLMNYLVLRKDGLKFKLLEIMLISSFLLCNLQYLINKNIHLSGHLEVRVVYPLIVLSLFTIFANLKFSKTFKTFFLLIILTFTCIYGLLNHFSYSRNYYNAYTAPNSELELYDWLNNHTSFNSVILSASLRTNLLMSALTHNYVYIPHSFLTSALSDEIIERVFLSHRLFGMNTASIDQLFSKNADKEQNILNRRWNFETCGAWFVYFTRYSNGNYYQCFIPDKEREKVDKNYDEFLISPEKINKFRFDYVIFGPYEKENGNLKELLANVVLTKVFENEDYLIFKR